jgi:hypothetical protein
MGDGFVLLEEYSIMFTDLVEKLLEQEKDFEDLFQPASEDEAEERRDQLLNSLPSYVRKPIYDGLILILNYLESKFTYSPQLLGDTHNTLIQMTTEFIEIQRSWAVEYMSGPNNYNTFVSLSMPRQVALIRAAIDDSNFVLGD